MRTKPVPMKEGMCAVARPGQRAGIRVNHPAQTDRNSLKIVQIAAGDQRTHEWRLVEDVNADTLDLLHLFAPLR